MKKINFNLGYLLLYLTGILMPCQIIAFKVIPLFLIAFILFFIFKTVLSAKMVGRIYGFYIMGLTLISGFMMYIGSLPNEWKESSRNQIILYLVIVLVLFLKFNDNEIAELIKGLRVGLFINIIWGFIQFVLFSFANFDINDVIFNKILSMREEATTFNNSLNTICITGLNWHPAQLVPIIILAYFLYDSILLRCLLIILAFISTNTTCIITLVLCLGTSFIKYNANRKVGKESMHVNTKAFLIILALIMIVTLAINGDVVSYFMDNAKRVITRVSSAYTGININNSTRLHLRYYTAYPLIFSYYGFKNALFGIGFECSGYPFTELFGQYMGMKSWHVESDLINFLVGRGIIWTISHYALLFIIVVKGRKISPKYAMIVLLLMGCGIFYNNNFLWVEFLIYILFIVINNNYNIFGSIKENKNIR